MPKAALAHYLLSKQPHSSKTALNWRIHELLQQGQILSIGRGRYALPQKAEYRPVIGERMRSIGALVKTGFPFLESSIFHTEQLSSFMQHIPGRHFLLLEVERVGMEALFYKLKDAGLPCYLQPDVATMQRYVAFEHEPLIIQPLLTEAPLLGSGEVAMPSLEKLLVDLACEKAIYSAFQGAELRYIYQNAFAAYQIRIDRMLRYADRRRRRDLILSYLNIFGIEVV